MEEKKPGLWKALRILAVVLLIFAVLAFLFVAFTFLVSFMIGGQIITDGTGLMRFFLHANNTGQRPIVAAKFGLAGMPALGAATLFLVYCCVLTTYLRKRKKSGSSLPGARGYLIALWVLTALTIVAQVVIWAVCRHAVAGSGYFTMAFPVPVLGVLALIVTSIVAAGAADKQESALQTPAQTEELPE